MSVIVRNSQIVPLSHLYISGCDVSIASTKIVAISPGQARDSSNLMDMPVGYQNVFGENVPPVLFDGYRQPLFVNSAVVGANGIDQGALAASSQYAVYLIGDSSQNNPVAGLLSLTSNANPVLPEGYDAVRLLGFIATDGSTNFVYATNKPQLMSRALAYYMSPVSVLSGGNATSFTAVDCDTAVNTDTLPNVILHLLVTFVPAAAGDIAQFRPTGSSATAGLVTIVGEVANVAQTQYLQIIAGVGSSKCEFDYLVTASGDSLTVLVVGFEAAPNVVYPT